MDWMSMLLDAGWASITSMLQIIVIVVPLLVILEILKSSGVIKKITDKVEPLTGKFRLPGEAALPMVVGVLVGLQIGAGVVMQVGREGVLTKKEMTITCVFIGICHGLIEETVLFTGIGGNPGVLLFSRVLAGLLFTSLYLVQLKYFPNQRAF